MTAEVLVLNATAIALAADSAVTIGRGQKIYNSAIKVFSLSKHEPVGVMIYGNADIMGIPWETIIKMYRKSLGNKSYERLEDYGDALIKFLREDNNVFTDTIKKRWFESNVTAYFIDIANECAEKMAPREEGDAAQENLIDHVVSRALEDRHQEIVRHEVITCFDLEAVKNIKIQYSSEIERAYADVFGDLLNDENKSTLVDLVVDLHVRSVFTNGYTGLVVCGYGDLDIFPAVSTFTIDGIVLDCVRYALNEAKSHRMKHENDCAIIPLAQEDMMASFMEGLNPLVKIEFVEQLNELLNILPNIAEECFSSNTGTHSFSIHLQEKINLILEGIQNHLQEKHITPIIDMVRVLPKDELAAMAESLVNLTAFKRRMTDELETVGGPIDVAVISKGDGFVWIKRKHYFDPKLNHHFFANYFQGE